MAGTWSSQNEILPGAYINIRTNEPLSITPGERGTVVLLQELTVGEDGEIYTITATEQNYPEKATVEDKRLATEALKKAKTVLLYKLPEAHGEEDVSAALEKLKTVRFNTLCYPYDTTPETAASSKTAITAWIKTMRDEEGVKCQAVLANHEADSEGILNVIQGIELSDGTVLTAAQATAWVAGATAGAGITTSNTNMAYDGAIDVKPRMTRTEMETAVKEGKFIFNVDSAQNVTVMYDVNSMTTVTDDKNKLFMKNRVIRTLDNIANDLVSIFESSYVGKINNDSTGRNLLKAAVVDYFTSLQNLGAIQDFDSGSLTVERGVDLDAVVVSAEIQPLDNVEKILITVNLI